MNSEDEASDTGATDTEAPRRACPLWIVWSLITTLALLTDMSSNNVWTCLWSGRSNLVCAGRIDEIFSSYRK